VVALDRGIAWIAASWLWVANLAVAAWLALIVSAPLLLAVGKEGLATVLYAMNQPLCHQRADRSFHLLGEKMACCERCFAIYAATFGFGLVFTVLRRLEPLSWRCAALLSLPVLLDALSQAPGWRESTTSLRVLTGGAVRHRRQLGRFPGPRTRVRRPADDDRGQGRKRGGSLATGADGRRWAMTRGDR
jgi:uncharacterized membrane protein